ncbi:hypothetical protein K2W90_05595 [Candidatus Babeliales bacterium]|nr:hypothetical protein [Candidatus Babeliales bacterium]
MAKLAKKSALHAAAKAEEAARIAETAAAADAILTAAATEETNRIAAEAALNNVIVNAFAQKSEQDRLQEFVDTLDFADALSSYGKEDFRTFYLLQGMIDYMTSNPAVVNTIISSRTYSHDEEVRISADGLNKITYSLLKTALENRRNTIFEPACDNSIKTVLTNNLLSLSTFDKYLTINRSNVTSWSAFSNDMLREIKPTDQNKLVERFFKQREHLINDAIKSSLAKERVKTITALFALLKVIHTEAGYAKIQVKKDGLVRNIFIVLVKALIHKENQAKITTPSLAQHGNAINQAFKNTFIECKKEGTKFKLYLNIDQINTELTRIVNTYPRLKNMGIIDNLQISNKKANLEIEASANELNKLSEASSITGLTTDIANYKDFRGTWVIEGGKTGGRTYEDFRKKIMSHVLKKIFDFLNKKIPALSEKTHFTYFFEPIKHRAKRIADFSNPAYLMQSTDTSRFLNIPDFATQQALFNQQVADIVQVFRVNKFVTTQLKNPLTIGTKTFSKDVFLDAVFQNFLTPIPHFDASKPILNQIISDTFGFVMPKTSLVKTIDYPSSTAPVSQDLCKWPLLFESTKKLIQNSIPRATDTLNIINLHLIDNPPVAADYNPPAVVLAPVAGGGIPLAPGAIPPPPPVVATPALPTGETWLIQKLNAAKTNTRITDIVPPATAPLMQTTAINTIINEITSTPPTTTPVGGTPTGGGSGSTGFWGGLLGRIGLGGGSGSTGTSSSSGPTSGLKLEDEIARAKQEIEDKGKIFDEPQFKSDWQDRIDSGNTPDKDWTDDWIDFATS